MTHQSTKSKSGLQLLTNHDARFGLPTAADEVYEPFSRWMDGKLAELVDRWLPLAAPNASRRKPARRSRGR